MSDFNTIQQIKRNFFSFRNGVIADSLKKGGSPYRLIFGLNLPQLNQIAQNIGEDLATAKQLHDDVNTRESQLLSSLIMPVDKIQQAEEAFNWLEGLRSKEAIDIACHKLIKKTSNPLLVTEMCVSTENSLLRYAGIRLLWNIYMTLPEESRSLALRAKALDKENERLIDNLIEEIDFIIG
ncbi:MAG: hypothetical protein J1E38_06295 [Paramuribaculum sp.]|nr:hypothetical protein [Paramuribaculum sp.]